MNHRHRSAALFAVLFAVVTLIGPSAEAAPAEKTRNLEFSLRLQSVNKAEHVLGNLQYGVNVLEGTTVIGTEKVAVERISVVQYVKGSGSIGGFVTLVWPNSDSIALSVTGQSELLAAETHIYGTLRLIAATGRWKGYSGIGLMEGLRKGPLGTPVDFDISISMSR